MELSDETYFYEQYQNSRAHVETILRQRLQGLRRTISWNAHSRTPGTTPACRGSGPDAAAGQPERAGLPGAGRRGAPVLNGEALVQTKSLSTQLPLTTNQRNPGCLVIAGNTGNVVCNTSFTNLSDSRVKTEMAEADLESSCSSSTPWRPSSTSPTT